MKELLITIGLAIIIALLQMVMKGLSRTAIKPKSHGLTQEDTLFWSDWVIAAGLSLTGALIVASNENKPIPTLQVVGCIGAILAGCVFLPFALRTFAYEENAKIRPLPPGGIGWILIANACGILILSSAVAVGVNVYGL
ncbi:MAG: hypothetical protein JO100_10885 [Pseudonocardia sp.]|nr:hypothetical protein [Pseudonocardia sp.]